VFIVVGFAVVFGSIVGGYILHHGQLGVLLQWSEFLIIGGAGAGAFLVSNSPHVVAESLHAIIGLLKPSPFTTEAYEELLQLMFESFQLARRNGIGALEEHVEKPQESPLFRKYPVFLQHPHAVSFFADTMKSLSSGAIEEHHLAEILDRDLERQRAEAMHVPHALTKLGDAMPGFGIVAAVLGVVITMGSIGGTATEIGEKIASALVGTFLGILLAYGVFAPLASAIESRIAAEHDYLLAVRSGLLAFQRGDSPRASAEAARRTLGQTVRPTFARLEDLTRKTRPAAA
jgi:chemotaxis protein MotA